MFEQQKELQTERRVKLNNRNTQVPNTKVGVGLVVFGLLGQFQLAGLSACLVALAVDQDALVAPAEPVAFQVAGTSAGQAFAASVAVPVAFVASGQVVASFAVAGSLVAGQLEPDVAFVAAA